MKCSPAQSARASPSEPATSVAPRVSPDAGAASAMCAGTSVTSRGAIGASRDACVRRGAAIFTAAGGGVAGAAADTGAGAGALAGTSPRALTGNGEAPPTDTRRDARAPGVSSITEPCVTAASDLSITCSAIAARTPTENAAAMIGPGARTRHPMTAMGDPSTDGTAEAASPIDTPAWRARSSSRSHSRHSLPGRGRRWLHIRHCIIDVSRSRRNARASRAQIAAA